jgi:hypothetical protein
VIRNQKHLSSGNSELPLSFMILKENLCRGCPPPSTELRYGFAAVKNQAPLSTEWVDIQKTDINLEKQYTLLFHQDSETM